MDRDRGHSGGNVDFNYLFAFYHSSASTFVAFVLDDAALTFACGAGFLATAVFRTCSVAMLALHILLHLECLGDTGGHILQRESHFQAQVRATMLCRASLSTAAKTAEAAKTAMTSKHIAKHREDIVHAESAAAESAVFLRP